MTWGKQLPVSLAMPPSYLTDHGVLRTPCNGPAPVRSTGGPGPLFRPGFRGDQVGCLASLGQDLEQHFGTALL
jgi:hypothetical protein